MYIIVLNYIHQSATKSYTVCISTIYQVSKIFFPSRDIFSIYLKMNKYAKQILDLVKSAIFNVTIEPCFFLFAMNYGFYIVVSRTLYINKVGKRRIKKLFHCLNIDESRNENSSIIHFFYRFVQLT